METPLPAPRSSGASPRRIWPSGGMLAATAFVLLWAATLLPFLAVGADNARLVAAFSTDEAMLLNHMSRLLEEHSFRLVFGAYGHLYLNVTMSILGWFGPVTDRTIVETARGISVACGAGLLLITFGWARRVYGLTAAWIALVLVACNPIVYKWAGMVHPDMLQSLLLLAALFYTAKSFDRPTTANVLLASAFAGLAFAAKYSGVFVLPLIAIAALGRRPKVGAREELRLILSRTALAVAGVAIIAVGYAIDAAWIVTHLTADGHIDVPLMLPLDTVVVVIRACGLLLALAVVLPWPWDALRRNRGVATMFWGFAVSTVTFLLVFAATSPYSLRKLAFVKGLYFEATETGAMMGVQWVEKWMHGTIGAVGWAIIVPCVCTAIWLLRRRRLHPLSSVEVVFLSWIGLYLAVLLAPFHEMLFHYTLPLIAPAAILGARGIVAACEALERQVNLHRRMLARAVAIAVVLVSLAPATTTLLAERETSLHRTASSNVVVGTWMTDRLPASTSIAYDSLIYIPPRFTSIVATWGGSRSWLAELNPDVVVVNGAIAGGWLGDPAKEAYYRCLENGGCGYERVFALDEIVVYQRRACGPADAADLVDDRTN